MDQKIYRLESPFSETLTDRRMSRPSGKDGRTHQKSTRNIKQGHFKIISETNTCADS